MWARTYKEKRACKGISSKIQTGAIHSNNSTVNIGAKVASITKYSNDYNDRICILLGVYNRDILTVACPLLQLEFICLWRGSLVEDWVALGIVRQPIFLQWLDLVCVTWHRLYCGSLVLDHAWPSIYFSAMQQLCYSNRVSS